MLVEFSIVPLGGDPHISEEIAEALKVLDTSGLPYQLTPSATCIEGEWDDVLPVIRLCHARVRAMSPHVMTLLKIEDDEGEHDKLKKNIASVEEKIGRLVPKQEAPSPDFSVPAMEEPFNGEPVEGSE